MSRRELLPAWLVVAALCFTSASLTASEAHAQYQMPRTQLQRGTRYQTYLALRRDPYQAAAWELLLPGAGSYYAGIYVNAAVSALTSVTGAVLWVHGGVTDTPATYWTGVGLFAGGRTYGLLTATIGSALINRALRRQLSLEVALGALRMRF